MICYNPLTSDLHAHTCTLDVEIRLHNETGYNAQCNSLHLKRGEWTKQLAKVIETHATNEGKARLY